MLTKRLEVLLEPEEYKEIQRQARLEGKSVGQVVRDLLRERLIKEKRGKAIRAFEKLVSPDMEIDISSWAEEKKKMLKGRLKEIETH